MVVECLSCPDFAQCRGGVAPVTRAGYWRVPWRDEALPSTAAPKTAGPQAGDTPQQQETVLANRLQCLEPAACVGAADDAAADTPPTNGTAGFVEEGCAEFYSGPLCAACTRHAYKQAASYLYLPCYDAPGLSALFVALVVASALAVIVGMTLATVADGGEASAVDVVVAKIAWNSAVISAAAASISRRRSVRSRARSASSKPAGERSTKTSGVCTRRAAPPLFLSRGRAAPLHRDAPRHHRHHDVSAAAAAGDLTHTASSAVETAPRAAASVPRPRLRGSWRWMRQTRFAPPPSTPDTRSEPAGRRWRSCGRRRPFPSTKPPTRRQAHADCHREEGEGGRRIRSPRAQRARVRARAGAREPRQRRRQCLWRLCRRRAARPSPVSRTLLRAERAERRGW